MPDHKINDGSPYFNPSFGNRPLRIVGREEELALIRRGLQGQPGSELRAPIIIGQRSFGKTSMLIEAESIATELGYACAGVAVNRSMLQGVLDGLLISGGKALGAKGKVEGVTLGASGFSLGLEVDRREQGIEGFQARLGVMLDELEKAGLGACILVDEVQPNYEEFRELTQTYQHYAGRGRNIALIMAGLPRCVSKALNDKVSTFLYRAERIALDTLGIDDVYLYFSQAFHDMGITFSEGEMLRAAQATGGMPYMMQLIGRNIAMLAPKGTPVSKTLVEEAVTLAKEKLYRNVFAACLDTMSPRDMAFAGAMLEDEGKSLAVDLKARMGLSDADYQQVRRRNLDNGIIVSHGYGSVEFAMPYFAEYLKTAG